MDGFDELIEQSDDVVGDLRCARGLGGTRELAEVLDRGRHDHGLGDLGGGIRLDVLDLDVALPVDLDARGEFTL